MFGYSGQTDTRTKTTQARRSVTISARSPLFVGSKSISHVSDLKNIFGLEITTMTRGLTASNVRRVG